MRRIVICLFACLLCGCSSGGDDNGDSLSTDACSVISLPSRIGLRIVNGTSCGNLQASPVVRVGLFDSLGVPLGFCTGSMLSRTAVLTAGHCFLGDPQLVIVNYGDIGATTNVSSRSYSIHPGFALSESAAFNDVAVVHLSRSVNLPILPILSSRSAEEGEVGAIFGYGTDEAGNLDLSDLQSGQMRVSSVTANHIGAEFEGEGSNTCTGDSGGPLILTVNGEPAIAGVTSSGSRLDCLEGDKSLFANLDSQTILDFLVDQVPDLQTR